jgi:hypothetical protein
VFTRRIAHRLFSVGTGFGKDLLAKLIGKIIPVVNEFDGMASGKIARRRHARRL